MQTRVNEVLNAKTDKSNSYFLRTYFKIVHLTSTNGSCSKPERIPPFIFSSIPFQGSSSLLPSWLADRAQESSAWRTRRRGRTKYSGCCLSSWTCSAFQRSFVKTAVNAERLILMRWKTYTTKGEGQTFQCKCHIEKFTTSTWSPIVQQTKKFDIYNCKKLFLSRSFVNFLLSGFFVHMKFLNAVCCCFKISTRSVVFFCSSCFDKLFPEFAWLIWSSVSNSISSIAARFYWTLSWACALKTSGEVTRLVSTSALVTRSLSQRAKSRSQSLLLHRLSQLLKSTVRPV